jgi:hypothetical protein
VPQQLVGDPHLTKLSLHQLGRTRTGVVIAGLVFAVLETSILVVAAYMTSPASIVFVPNTGHPSLTDDYIGAIWSIALLLTIGLAAFSGYLLQEERTGILVLLFSQAIAFALALWTFLQFPLANGTGTFGESLFVAGLAIVVFLLGSLAVFGGMFLRDRGVPDWRVRLDWRLLVAGLLTDAIAVLWPITPPYAQGYVQGSVNFSWAVPLRLGDLAYPVIAVLAALGLFLVLLGFRRGVSTSFATLPIVIGSVVVGGSGVVAHGFTSSVSDYFEKPASFGNALAIAHVQAFSTLGWLVVFSLAVPTITILGVMYSGKIRQPSPILDAPKAGIRD